MTGALFRHASKSVYTAATAGRWASALSAAATTSTAASSSQPLRRGYAQHQEELSLGPSGTWRGYNAPTGDWIKPKSTKYDVVVVGGGHNGLVSAAYLGKQGLNVLVRNYNPFLLLSVFRHGCV